MQESGRVADLPNIADVDRHMVERLQQETPTPARDAALYHLSTGGQRMRAHLALASARVSLNEHDSIQATAACELLHNASLIHDDISDRDLFRRGRQTVRARYGDNIALCAGDLLLTTAFATAAGLQDRDHAVRLTADMAALSNRVIGGQSIELAAGDHRDFNRRQYLAATRGKTAPFIELAVGVGRSATRQSGFDRSTCHQLAEAIGLAYQILDDLDDLGGSQEGLEHQPLHALHAWWHHQSIARPHDRSLTHRRCLAHVRAAVNRAQSCHRKLPMPLRAAVGTLLRQLQEKADRSARRIDGGLPQ